MRVDTILRAGDSIGSPIVAFILILAGAAIIVLSIAYAVGTYQRAANMLSEWATRNGYLIIESERRGLLKGPFFLTSNSSQIIYRVTVQDASGNTRRGWVRCGGRLLGTLQNQVDVRWDE